MDVVIIRKKQKTDALMHSGTYLGADYSDGLKHYKYIRKYKKNGKWVYIYEAQKLKEDTHEFLTGKKAKNAMDDASFKKAISISERDRALEFHMENHGNEYAQKLNKKTYDKAVKDVVKYTKEYNKSLKAYEKTFPGRISKAKKWLKKQFGLK